MTDAEIDEILRQEYYRETRMLKLVILSCNQNFIPDNPEKVQTWYERLVRHLKKTGKWREE